MGRVARTLELVEELRSPGAIARAGALQARHGRAALRDAHTGTYVGVLLPRIYVHRANSGEFATRAAAAMEWLPHSVALTGLAACAIYGLLEHEPALLRAAAPSPLHVRSPDWLKLRRCTRRSLTHDRGGVRVVSVAEALVHAWEEDPFGGAREAIFAALRMGLSTVAEVRAALDYYPRVKGRWRLKAFLAHLRDGMHSYLEYHGARKVLNTADLKPLLYQAPFVVEGNRFAVDRYDPRTKTAIEFDGARWHSEQEDRERDTWRDGMLSRIGVHTIRLPYIDVMRQPARCRAKVRATIAARAGPT